MGDYAAKRIVELVQQNPKAVLFMPTGKTMIPMYRSLVQMLQEGCDLSGVTTFNLDEYVIDPKNPRSFRSYMDEHFFNLIPTPPEKRYFPDVTHQYLEQACEDYEAIIKSSGQIDFALLGVGEDGHVAFHRPGVEFSNRTHVADVKDLGVSGKALTMGVSTILGAKEIMVLVTQPEKVKPVAAFLSGPVDKSWPVSGMRQHPGTTLVTTEDVLRAVVARKPEVRWHYPELHLQPRGYSPQPPRGPGFGD